MTKAFDNIYPIGLGTGRFPFGGTVPYQESFDKAVELVLYALEHGVNYIDVGRDYSQGHAYGVLKEAFRRTKREFYVTVKITSYDAKVSAEEYYREALSVLDAMGLERASHFLLWTLMNRLQFERAVSKGHLYDAALRLREEGKIKYIGASLHMQHDDILAVIDSGLFEFLLISYNLLNFLDMQRVLDRAYEKGVDILVMNPLYGGLIPQNESLFSYARHSGDENTVQAAVRAVLAHPAVKCVLAGASSKAQMDIYLSAAEDFASNPQARRERLAWLKETMKESKTFCSYCRYCADCPKGIPVPELMNARNSFLLQEGTSRNAARRTYFRVLHEKFDVSFDTGRNPCIQCGKCESRCTQHLPIISSIQEVFDMVRDSAYDRESRRRRFEDLLLRDGYQKVGLWPASAGTMKILEICKDVCGELPFEVFLFDSNADYHGKERFGHVVHSKGEAKNLGVECVLITSYQHGKAIHGQIRDVEEQGIAVKELYREGDVDWWW